MSIGNRIAKILGMADDPSQAAEIGPFTEPLRIYALARLLGVDASVVLDVCRDLGMDPKNQLSAIDPIACETVSQRIRAPGFAPDRPPHAGRDRSCTDAMDPAGTLPIPPPAPSVPAVSTSGQAAGQGTEAAAHYDADTVQRVQREVAARRAEVEERHRRLRQELEELDGQLNEPVERQVEATLAKLAEEEAVRRDQERRDEERRIDLIAGIVGWVLDRRKDLAGRATNQLARALDMAAQVGEIVNRVARDGVAELNGDSSYREKRRVVESISAILKTLNLYIANPQSGAACNLLAISDNQGGKFVLAERGGEKRSHTTRDLADLLPFCVVWHDLGPIASLAQYGRSMVTAGDEAT